MPNTTKQKWLIIYDTEDCLGAQDIFYGSYYEMQAELTKYRSSPYFWNIQAHELYDIESYEIEYCEDETI